MARARAPYVHASPRGFFEKARQMFENPVVVYYWDVRPAYCGMKTDRWGQAHDYYAVSYYIVVADGRELEERVRKADTRVLEEVDRELRELGEWLEYHANVCGTWDCANVRMRTTQETYEKVLTMLGARYAVFHVSFCDETEVDEEEFQRMLDEMGYDLDGDVAGELCERNPAACEEDP